MTGVGLVGLSGSMIKEAVKEGPLGFLLSTSADVPTTEPVETPQATRVLVGVFFILFAQILYVPSRSPRVSRVYAF